MNLKNYEITVGEILQNPRARAMLQKELPMVMRHPLLPVAQAIPIKDIINNAGVYVPQKKINSIVEKLKSI